MTPARTLLAILALCTATSARAGAVAVTWDCFFSPEGSANCAQLEEAFFGATPLVVRAGYSGGTDADAPAAELAIVLRAAAFTGGIEYSVDITDAHGQRVRVVDRVPDAFTDAAVVASGGSTAGGGGGGNGGGGGADTGGGGGRGTGGGSGRGRVTRSAVVTSRLVGDLQKAVAPLLNMTEHASTTGGTMTLALNAPSEAVGQARVEDSAARWYVSPTLSGSLAQTALQRTEIDASIEANWSLPGWRVVGDAWLGVNSLTAPGPRPEDEPTSFGYLVDGVELTAVRTLGAGFSVGANAVVANQPDLNYLVRAAGYTGVEWVLLAFPAPSGGDFGFRYTLGGEHQEYVHQNVEKRFEDDFLRHRLVAFGLWHFARVDLSGFLAASSVVKDPTTFYDVSSLGQVSFRLLDDLSVSLNASASYRHALINAPDNLNELDPLERFIGGANFGQVNYSTTVSFVYVLGNSLLAKQDQRFTNGAETN